MMGISIGVLEKSVGQLVVVLERDGIECDVHTWRMGRDSHEPSRVELVASIGSDQCEFRYIANGYGEEERSFVRYIFGGGQRWLEMKKKTLDSIHAWARRLGKSAAEDGTALDRNAPFEWQVGWEQEVARVSAKELGNMDILDIYSSTLPTVNP